MPLRSSTVRSDLASFNCEWSFLRKSGERSFLGFFVPRGTSTCTSDVLGSAKVRGCFLRLMVKEKSPVIRRESGQQRFSLKRRNYLQDRFITRIRHFAQH